MIFWSIRKQPISYTCIYRADLHIIGLYGIQLHSIKCTVHFGPGWSWLLHGRLNPPAVFGPGGECLSMTGSQACVPLEYSPKQYAFDPCRDYRIICTVIPSKATGCESPLSAPQGQFNYTKDLYISCPYPELWQGFHLSTEKWLNMMWIHVGQQEL